MSLYDYKVSMEMGMNDYPFYALIMAAMRKADTDNLFRLQRLFPETWQELRIRYNAPGGLLEGEK
jgi:hypothetical protein